MDNKSRISDLFLNFINHSNSAIIFAAPDNSILSANISACKLLGYREKEILALSTSNIGLSRNLNNIIDLKKKNGETITVAAKFQTQNIGDKDYTMITLEETSFYSLSGIEQVEQQFFQNSNRNTDSVVSIWSLDNDFRYTFFSEIHRKLMKQTWGCDIKLGDRLPDLIPHKQYRKRVIQTYTKILEGTPHRSVDKFKSHTGEDQYRENFGNPIFVEGDRVSGIMFSSIDITGKIKAEQALVGSLKEKEILLKEIHHRVKNNLQQISSMINLQISMVDDKTTIRILQDSLSRIRTMGSIHETLYLGEDLNQVNMKNYCGLLIKSFMELYESEYSNIDIVEKIDDINLYVEQAIPVGLIMSELITNSMKYAFRDRAVGIITINLTRTDSGHHLQVSDNGEGADDKFRIASTSTLGVKLVSVFTEQLGGRLEYSSNEGFTVDVYF